MDCPKCEHHMILTQATNFGPQYFYCKVCKKELIEIERMLPKLEEAPKEVRCEELDFMGLINAPTPPSPLNGPARQQSHQKWYAAFSSQPCTMDPWLQVTVHNWNTEKHWLNGLYCNCSSKTNFSDYYKD